MLSSGGLVQSLLDRERRPQLLLDRRGVVLHANRAVTAQLLSAEQLVGVSLLDGIVAEESRALLVSALSARSEEASTLRIRFRRPQDPSEFEVELFHFATVGEEDLVLLTLLRALSSGQIQLAPATGGTYEIEIRNGQPGRVLRAAEAERAAPLVPADAPCWRAVHGQETPCSGCPVSALAGCDRAMGVVPRGTAGAFSVSLVFARRVSADVAAVTLVEVGEAELGLLHAARMDFLADQSNLSSREREVLSLLLLGRGAEQIATVLGVSTRMAKYHQQAVLQKLGAESRFDLFRLFC